MKKKAFTPEVDLSDFEFDFKNLLLQAPMPIAIYVGEEMVIELANDAMLKLWGKDRSVLKLPLKKAIPELHGQPFFDLLDQVYQTGITYQAEEDEAKLVVDGKLQSFYFNFTYKPLRNSKGNIYAIMNTAVDVTSHFLAKQQLNEAKERMIFALNSAELGTWDMYPFRKLVKYDKRCKELFGLAKDNLASYHEVLGHIYPEDKRLVLESIQKALGPNSEGNYEVEFRTVNSDDLKIKWVRCKGRAYFNEQGRAWRFVGTALDISKEIELRNEQQKLITLVDNSAELMSILEPDGRNSYINKAGKALLGFENDQQVLNTPIAELHSPEDYVMVEKELFPAINKKGRWSGKMWVRHLQTGEVFPVYNNSIRIDDPRTGEPVAIGAVMRDLRPEFDAMAEQHKLLTMVDNSSDFMGIADWEGNVLYLNEAAKELVGLQDEKIDKKRRVEEFYTPEHFATIRDVVVPELLRAGKWSGQIFLKNFKTGEIIPGHANAIRISDPLTGKPVARGFAVRDLRPELKAQQALAESELLLRNITTAAPTGLWMSDAKGMIKYINHAWINWTGLGLEQNLGMGWINAILPEDRKRTLDKFFSDMQARKYYEADFRIKRQDGQLRWCIATGNPQFKDDDTFTGYIGTWLDVTERKEFEQQLLESANKLNSILEGLPQIAYTATPDGRIDYFTKKWYEYTGLTEQESKDHLAVQVIPDSEREIAINTWNDDIKSDTPHRMEARIRRKDGMLRWHLSVALPIHNTKGEVVSWVGTLTDIHEEKELQRHKDDFLGIASHELKTPVTSIKAYTQVLELMLRKSGDVEKAAMLGKMDGQINRLNNLIADLLDITKIQRGKINFNRETFDFNELVSEIVEELQRTTDRHTIYESYDMPCQIFADKFRIGQVITNLLSNAIKYSPECDRINVYTKCNGLEIQLGVEDFGIGIPADKIHKVFEQFYRVSDEKQYIYPGLGLGLYISSEIVKREGGRIWVDSIEGKGSVFCFSLPINRRIIKP